MPIDCKKAVILARGLGTRMRRPEGGLELTSAQSAVAETGLKAMIPIGRPFLDFVFSRTNPDGSQQRFQVSGEPMFGPACQFLGYRGIGLEITARK